MFLPIIQSSLSQSRNDLINEGKITDREIKDVLVEGADVAIGSL